MSARSRTHRKESKSGRSEEYARLGLTDPFGREAGGFLAVLILAAYWPSRFPDGWVTTEDVGAHSRDLPKLDDKLKEDTLRRNVRTAVEELGQVLPDGLVERRVVHGIVKLRDPREAVTRLTGWPSSELQEWFRHFGLSRLDSDVRKDFRQHSYGQLGTPENAHGVIAGALVQQVIRAREYDAARMSALMFMNYLDPYQERLTMLVLAQIAFTRNNSDCNTEVIDLLTPAVESALPTYSGAHQLLLGRIHLALARAHTGQALEVRSHGLDKAREHLEQARAFIPLESHLDCGDLGLAEGHLACAESRYACDERQPSEDVARHRGNAQRAIVGAICEWGLAQRWDNLAEAIALLLRLPGGLMLRDAEQLSLDFRSRWLATIIEYSETITDDNSELLIRVTEDIANAFIADPPPAGSTRGDDQAVAAFLLLRYPLSVLEVRSWKQLKVELPPNLLAIRECEWFREAEQRAERYREAFHPPEEALHQAIQEAFQEIVQGEFNEDTKAEHPE